MSKPGPASKKKKLNPTSIQDKPSREARAQAHTIIEKKQLQPLDKELTDFPIAENHDTSEQFNQDEHTNSLFQDLTDPAVSHQPNSIFEEKSDKSEFAIQRQLSVSSKDTVLLSQKLNQSNTVPQKMNSKSDKSSTSTSGIKKVVYPTNEVSQSKSKKGEQQTGSKLTESKPSQNNSDGQSKSDAQNNQHTAGTADPTPEASVRKQRTWRQRWSSDTFLKKALRFKKISSFFSDPHATHITDEARAALLVIRMRFWEEPAVEDLETELVKLHQQYWNRVRSEAAGNVCVGRPPLWFSTCEAHLRTRGTLVKKPTTEWEIDLATQSELASGVWSAVRAAVKEGGGQDLLGAAVRHVAQTLGLSLQRISTLWNRMRVIAVEKLRLLVRSGDRAQAGGPELMTKPDWHIADALLLAAEGLHLVTENSLTMFDQLQALTMTFYLARAFQLEEAGTALNWTNALHAYTTRSTRGTMSSLLVLQRRWYELKAQTRAAITSAHRARRRDGRPVMAQPHPIYWKIARAYPGVVTSPTFPSWSELVRSGAIHTDPVEVTSSGRWQDQTDNKLYEALCSAFERPENAEEDNDLILVAKDVETIDLIDEDPAGTQENHNEPFGDMDQRHARDSSNPDVSNQMGLDAGDPGSIALENMVEVASGVVGNHPSEVGGADTVCTNRASDGRLLYITISGDKLSLGDQEKKYIGLEASSDDMGGNIFDDENTSGVNDIENIGGTEDEVGNLVMDTEIIDQEMQDLRTVEPNTIGTPLDVITSINPECAEAAIIFSDDDNDDDNENGCDEISDDLSKTDDVNDVSQTDSDMKRTEGNSEVIDSNVLIASVVDTDNIVNNSNSTCNKKESKNNIICVPMVSTAKDIINYEKSELKDIFIKDSKADVNDDNSIVTSQSTNIEENKHEETSFKNLKAEINEIETNETKVNTVEITPKAEILEIGPLTPPQHEHSMSEENDDVENIDIVRVDWKLSCRVQVHLHRVDSLLPRPPHTCPAAASNGSGGARPSSAQYSREEDLSRNPDFDIRLKGLSASFLSVPSNLVLLGRCVPLTVDLVCLSPRDVSPGTSRGRDRRIQLPDIEEVRRVNRSLLTAQVAPTTHRPAHGRQTSPPPDDASSDKDEESEWHSEWLASVEEDDDGNSNDVSLNNDAGKGDDVSGRHDYVNDDFTHSGPLSQDELSSMLKDYNRFDDLVWGKRLSSVLGGIGQYCCLARRHVAINTARRRMQLNKPAPITYMQDVNIHRHAEDASCSCCCARLLRGEHLRAQHIGDEQSALFRDLANINKDSNDNSGSLCEELQDDSPPDAKSKKTEKRKMPRPKKKNEMSLAEFLHFHEEERPKNYLEECERQNSVNEKYFRIYPGPRVTRPVTHSNKNTTQSKKDDFKGNNVSTDQAKSKTHDTDKNISESDRVLTTSINSGFKIIKITSDVAKDTARRLVNLEAVTNEPTTNPDDVMKEKGDCYVSPLESKQTVSHVIDAAFDKSKNILKVCKRDSEKGGLNVDGKRICVVDGSTKGRPSIVKVSRRDIDKGGFMVDGKRLISEIEGSTDGPPSKRLSSEKSIVAPKIASPNQETMQMPVFSQPFSLTPINTGNPSQMSVSHGNTVPSPQLTQLTTVNPDVTTAMPIPSAIFSRDISVPVSAKVLNPDPNDKDVQHIKVVELMPKITEVKSLVKKEELPVIANVSSLSTDLTSAPQHNSSGEPMQVATLGSDGTYHWTVPPYSTEIQSLKANPVSNISQSNTEPVRVYSLPVKTTKTDIPSQSVADVLKTSTNPVATVTPAATGNVLFGELEKVDITPANVSLKKSKKLVKLVSSKSIYGAALLMRRLMNESATQLVYFAHSDCNMYNNGLVAWRQISGARKLERATTWARRGVGPLLCLDAHAVLMVVADHLLVTLADINIKWPTYWTVAPWLLCKEVVIGGARPVTMSGHVYQSVKLHNGTVYVPLLSVVPSLAVAAGLLRAGGSLQLLGRERGVAVPLRRCPLTGQIACDDRDANYALRILFKELQKERIRNNMSSDVFTSNIVNNDSGNTTCVDMHVADNSSSNVAHVAQPTPAANTSNETITVKTCPPWLSGRKALVIPSGSKISSTSLQNPGNFATIVLTNNNTPPSSSATVVSSTVTAPNSTVTAPNSTGTAPNSTVNAVNRSKVITSSYATATGNSGKTAYAPVINSTNTASTCNSLLTKRNFLPKIAPRILLRTRTRKSNDVASTLSPKAWSQENAQSTNLKLKASNGLLEMVQQNNDESSSFDDVEMMELKSYVIELENSSDE